MADNKGEQSAAAQTQIEPAFPKNEFYITGGSQAQFDELTQNLRQFWTSQKKEITRQTETEPDFKIHNDFPLARIKRIMKSDEDVRMIRAEAPILFAKACELFILELTVRSYAYSEKAGERHNISKKDIEACIRNTAVFDFLVDVLDDSLHKDRKKKGAKK